MNDDDKGATQNRNPKTRRRREATAVGANMVVASDVGLGAGESAAEAAMINMAMATKKSFIFNASIVSESSTFLFERREEGRKTER
ncbi:hypothetical protein LR48_Vigan10g148700 [Vigna angularis]|uniref:Uncharacterized protein n=2 Tax=Phaseolus angularis TaxID=3914 RepID=A0A0L9VKL8_PHAAN|nr:hypothetical protein LR48_Vigan10g148700 [Vigna angularis]BAU01934.1 hypothetical protein VIGAN_11130300 [Vigna angularis var. angularis]